MGRKPKRVVGILEEGDKTIQEMPDDVQKIIKKYALQNPLVIRVIKNKKSSQNDYYYRTFKNTLKKVNKLIKPSINDDITDFCLKFVYYYLLDSITKNDLFIILQAKSNRRLRSIIREYGLDERIIKLANNLYYNEL